MTGEFGFLFPALWIAWVGYWLLLARNVKETSRRESVGSRLSHIVPLVIAVTLLALPRLRIAALNERFVPATIGSFLIAIALTLAGLLFTVWARVHLGRNWSGTVTVKQGHELITSGPYAIVRHPIYTGLLIAFIGSAVGRGEWRGVLAVALALIAFLLKIRLEERWMREQFGAQYQAYSERVAPLIPFVH